MTVENILALPFKEQKELIFSMTSEELTKLHEEVSNYIEANGNNDTLQWLLDKTFEIGYLRGQEEENPGLSLVGIPRMSKTERFVNSEIDRLKDELSHLQKDYTKMMKDNLDSFATLAEKAESVDSEQGNAEVMAETINIAVKNGILASKIVEIQRRIKRFTDFLEKREK